MLEHDCNPMASLQRFARCFHDGDSEHYQDVRLLADLLILRFQPWKAPRLGFTPNGWRVQIVEHGGEIKMK